MSGLRGTGPLEQHEAEVKVDAEAVAAVVIERMERLTAVVSLATSLEILKRP